MKRLSIVLSAATALIGGLTAFGQNKPPESVKSPAPYTNAVEEVPESDWQNPAPPGVGFMTGGVSRVKGPAAAPKGAVADIEKTKKSTP